MNDLLEKIYENVIRQEADTLDMEKRINDYASQQPVLLHV